MQLNKIKQMAPRDIFIYWIKERESIRKIRNIGIAKPWTDDTILQRYRFCNVIRKDDRVSKWLLDNWYLPNKNHKNMLVAAAIARHFNNPDSLGQIGFPKKWSPKTMLKVLHRRMNRGLNNFSGAYVIGGPFGGPKVDQVVNIVVQPLFNQPPEIDTGSMENTVRSLLPYKGLNTFLAGQITADLRWALDGEWRDRRRWAPIGPGSRRGMNRFLGEPTEDAMPQSAFESYFPTVMEYCKLKLNSQLFKRMEAIDVQNCLCEFDKYCRILLDKGRGKRKFQGVI